ncbi:TPA: hypothetical protein ACH3X3_006669 [Trebouxia sp. C0006]
MEVRPARRCSSCGQQGHNARTCLEKDERIGSARPLDHTLQEAASQDRFERQGSADGSSHLQDPASRVLGQAASMSGSESEALNVSQLPHISRERRRGTPWTEEEHRAFLAGLDKLGKGDWRGISKDYVTTRTPTQVASHAQKYFIRHNNQSKRKRRTSLFDLKADAEVLETGSAEATSAAWPERTLQHSSSVSGHGHTLPGPPQLASGVVDRSSLPSAHQSNAAPFASHMWLPAGPDMAFMQHYMQMAAGQVDPAVLQMAQYQMAAAHGLNFPGFPGFPPPGIAEQVMAAYAAQAAASFTPACFPPFPPTGRQPDSAQLVQQQAAAAALASTLYAQQQPQAQHQAAAQLSSAPATAASEQAATANPFALPQAAAACQGASPAFHQSAERGSPQAGLHQESHQQSLPHNGRFAQQQPAKPADSSPRDNQQGLSLLPARLPVKDDPAFGNGRLYRPQASHAKPSVAPPSTKFGGAINDNPQSGSLLSTNSSSESVLPPAGCCFEGAGKHTAPLQS